MQYRFATPKPLKARPGPRGCKTAPLCNRVLVDSHRCSSPLFLINSEFPGAARSRPGREARRSRSLDCEDRAVQSRAQGKGAWPALWRRSRLRSGLWILKSSDFLFPQDQSLLLPVLITTCLLYVWVSTLHVFFRGGVSALHVFSGCMGVRFARGKLPGFTQVCGNRQFMASDDPGTRV